MTLILATLLFALLIAAKAGASIPDKLAKEARYVASHGGVLSTRHGDATPRMKQLARRLVAARFQEAGPWAVQTALCVVRHESGFNPFAISSTGDYGLPQMNRASHEQDFPAWWKPAHGFRYLIFDPVFAVGAMFAMSARGTDWSAWTGTYGQGMCR